MTTPIRTIRNIFISVKKNLLQLANIRFTDRIEAIELVLLKPVDWDEIASQEKRARFLRKIERKIRPNGPKETDGHFLLLMPGAIDGHVHFDTPGFEFREDFEHASSAALWGGVTTVIDMPCTSVPAVTSLANMKTKLQALQNRAFCDYAFWGGISGTDFENLQILYQNIADLVQAGVVGFKAYLISGMEDFTDLLPEQMSQAAQWTKKLGVPLAVHAEDKNLVVSKRQKFQAQGRNDWRSYCSARDIKSEENAVALMRSIAEETQANIHIVHLSSAQGLQIVRDAQKIGLPLGAETCPHYLFFTQDDFEREGIRNYLKTAPPVKFADDRQALWQGLSDGTLRFVTTDHAGCDPEKEKISDNFWQVYGGIPGIEHRVPFILSEGFLKGRLTLEQAIHVLSSNVANFFSLTQKGTLKKGKDADFALIDLWNPWRVKAEQMHSKGKYTPFQGITFGAKVVKTFLRGTLAMDANQNYQITVPIGKFITRTN